jgi:hypothetical protein
MLFGCVQLVNFLGLFFVLAHVAIFSIKKSPLKERANATS